MLAYERRNKIREMILCRGSVKVIDLVDEFNVSDETIRRDLSYLESIGFVKKNYGGAVFAGDTNSSFEVIPPVRQRQYLLSEEKDLIGKKAAELVDDHQVVILDSGTTTLCVARHLKRVQDLTIVTNGINVADECSQHESSSIYVVGGKLIKESMSLIGPQAQKEIQNYSADIVFLGTPGISLRKGFTTSDIYEAEVKKVMVAAGQMVAIVADHSKFEKQGFTTFASFEDVDFLVTSDLTNESILGEIENMGVQIIVCSTQSK